MFQNFNKHKQTRSTPCTCANNGPCDMGAARFKRKQEHQRMKTKRQKQNRGKTKDKDETEKGQSDWK